MSGGTPPIEPRIAIIGAGIAGLSCARSLADGGLSPIVFEKSRGLGGRLATRRAGEGMAFDHGAQFLTARSPAFRDFVESAQRAETAAGWSPRIAGEGGDAGRGWYVGVPAMNALVKPLAEGLDIRLRSQVASIERKQDAWFLQGVEEPGDARFDVVVSTVPAPQARALLGETEGFAGRLDQVAIDPCWSLMLAFGAPFDPGFDVWRSDHGPLSVVARNNSKPRRAAGPGCWVVHASPAWSRENLERPAEEIAVQMTAMLAEALGGRLPAPRHAVAHRWRYAKTRQALGTSFLCNDAQTLLAGGDWCLGARVEFGFESGQAMAMALLGALKC